MTSGRRGNPRQMSLRCGPFSYRFERPLTDLHRAASWSVKQTILVWCLFFCWHTAKIFSGLLWSPWLFLFLFSFWIFWSCSSSGCTGVYIPCIFPLIWFPYIVANICVFSGFFLWYVHRSGSCVFSCLGFGCPWFLCAVWIDLLHGLECWLAIPIIHLCYPFEEWILFLWPHSFSSPRSFLCHSNILYILLSSLLAWCSSLFQS